MLVLLLVILENHLVQDLAWFCATEEPGRRYLVSFQTMEELGDNLFVDP
jgi:hypothetical protein